jgi:fermentation-respiration switch protein FrsA (DUF1100 family)
MKKLILVSIAVLTMINTFSQNNKTFPPSEKVTVERIEFKNRLGILLVGDLYLPKNIDRSKKSSAVVVGHPYGGVKEQTSGLYAQTMAERGFVTLAFDASYNGESGGERHSIASPEAFVEDYSAAVDFLGTRPFVDKNRIGVIGICGGGGFSVSAAAIDPRMRAIATVSMYDMGRANRQNLNDTKSEKERKIELEKAAEQRYAEFVGGPTKYDMGVPKSVDESSHAVEREFYDYYRTPRGQHPRSTTNFSNTSKGALMNFFPFTQIETISPRPILFIVGEIAHSRYFSEDAYKLAAEPKELYVVPGAGHVDLYDRLQYIPFDKLTSFFKENLK